MSEMQPGQQVDFEGAGALSGSTVGRFAIRSLLGAGGMGEVYRADDTRLKRPVALKRLAPHLSADDHFRKLLQQEAEQASALNHPHIAGVYDVLEDNGEMFVVMEFVEGRTLRRRLEESHGVKLFWETAPQLAAALAAAHAKDIVHRDIKPANIMVRDDGTVKILDFGIAKRQSLSQDELATISLATSSGDVFAGTVPYMPPEILEGKEADARGDIFSLGVVFYEILTGHHPFQAATPAVTMGNILHVDPAPVSQLNSQASADLDRLVDRMLAKNPAERYSTLRGVLADVQYLAGRAERAPTLPVTPTVSKRKTRRAALAAVAAAVLIVGGLSLWRFVGRPEPVPAPYLAVQPFQNASGDPQLDYYSNGLTETLITRLAGLQGMYVFAAKDDSLARLALEGGVQKSGDLVRITYRLVDGQQNRTLGSGVVEGPPAEVFLLQDRVSAEVGRWLRAEMGLRVEYRAPQKPTEDVGAYDLYLQGRDYLKRYEIPRNLDIAVRLFQQALEKDPEYSLAHAGLAEAYWHRYLNSRETSWVERALQAGRRAVELDEHQAAAAVALGNIQAGVGQYEAAADNFLHAVQQDATYDAAYRGLAAAYSGMGRAEEAESAYRRAIELHPDYWAGYSHLGAYYYLQGRYADASAMFERVVQLTPDNARGYANLGGIYHLMGRFDEAVRSYQRALEIRPDAQAYSNLGVTEFFRHDFSASARAFEQAVELLPSYYGYWANLGDAYSFAEGEQEKSAGAYRRSIELVQKALDVNPQDVFANASLARAYAKLEEREKALAALQRYVSLSQENVNALFEASLAYQLLGQSDRALEFLRQAVEKGYPVVEVRNHPELQALNSRPEFQKLVEE